MKWMIIIYLIFYLNKNEYTWYKLRNCSSISWWPAWAVDHRVLHCKWPSYAGFTTFTFCCFSLQAVQKKTRLQCKCHGVSGSCASRTCWSAQMEFREVGKLLKRKYEGAVQVTMNNQMALVSVDGTKPYTKLDLIYFEPSPDFCSINKSLG